MSEKIEATTEEKPEIKEVQIKEEVKTNEKEENEFIPIDEEKDENQETINLDSGDDFDDFEEGKSDKGGSKKVKIDKAIHIVEKDEFNTDAWRVIMNEVKNMPIDDARAYYERFLTKFPTAVL